MQVNNRDIDTLIISYFSGTLDKSSFQQLKDWAAESEENRKYIREKMEVWFSSGAVDEEVAFNAKKAFERFQNRVADAERQKEHVHRFSWTMFLKAAAVVLIIILPITAYWQGQQVVKQNFADIVIEAPLGSCTKLNLPDGTLVWLNAGSKIIYSQGFGVDDRSLKLIGEGYFEVAHNKETPFKINTKELDLKVVGTKFNFRNYLDDKEIAISLLEGKVALVNKIKKMPELYLEPDEKMVLNKVTGEMKKLKTMADKSNLWMNDELFFDEILLEDIAKQLSRSFNVRIVVADSLKERRFYGSFKVQGNTVNQILQTMSSTNQLRYRCVNGDFVIY
ncbi:FecR family protein [Bacteroides ilei]|uniref:FecR family protein n=1 Tax=Bacteroides ilei TaxID=1907658 RepID=UPI0009307B13|nr:FecR domain-containing protein [Bacteroides ilei]